MRSELGLTMAVYSGCAVVFVAGEVDMATAADLNSAAVTALREHGPHLVLDLTQLSFMDSTGLKVLLALQQRVPLGGGRLVLVNPPRATIRVLTVTGVDRTFVIRESIEAAAAACTGGEVSTGTGAPPASRGTQRLPSP